MKIINYILTAISIILLSALNADDWSLDINAVNFDTSIPGDWITMGVCEGCHDGFQYNEDEVDIGSGPIPMTNIQFKNPNWLGQYDSNGNECLYSSFFSDYKSIHEPSDLLIWTITGACPDTVQTISDMFQLSWTVDTLAQEYEIYMYAGDNEIDMRYTTSASISCELLTPTWNLIDGVWVTITPSIRILMGGCASSGLTTFYWDDDGDGLGSDTYSQYCSDFEPEGWVNNDNDLDDSIFCESNDFDSCWVCDGYDYMMDCNGVCAPETPIGQTQEDEGLIYGAFFDDCGICSGGGTEHDENSDQDCNGDCFGDAFVDDCDVCSGGNAGHEENSDQDCAGECFGNGFDDYCDECNGYNQSCLDLIFGDGPSDLYAQIDLDADQTNLTWIYSDINISNQILGYKVYELTETMDMNLIATIESSDYLSYSIDGYTSGTFCLTAYDIYNNETTPICAEASEFSNFNFTLADGANLISFPYLSNDDVTVGTIFSSIVSYIDGLIGEGVSAIYNEGIGGWTGSLSEIERRDGYWVKINLEDSEATLNFSVSGIPTDPNTVYNLHDGANLISYVGINGVLVGDALPDNMEYLVEAIIGEGVAAAPNPVLGWVGSLETLQLGAGYWLRISPEVTSVDLVWNLDNGQSSDGNPFNKETKKITPFGFTQSTLQSFYFIRKITANTFNLDDGDVIISYCNDIITGSRYYNGEYTDVPAMGADGDNTVGYCSSLDIPNFKIYDTETNRIIDLFGEEIPNWENLGISEIVLSDLSSDVIPDKTEIISTYPNPFNPSTKINFNINKNQHVELIIYDIQGSVVQSLINQKLEAGTHSINWSPNNISSGVYILSLDTPSTTISSKLLYIK